MHLVHLVPTTGTYLPPFRLALYHSIANTETKLAGIHMGLFVNSPHSRSPHRQHARGKTAQVRLALALGTVSAHQRLVPNPSHLISVRGRNAIWWVMIKQYLSPIPIPYHLSPLSPSSPPPLHHILPIIQFRRSPPQPPLISFDSCSPSPSPPSPRHLMYLLRCFLSPARLFLSLG